MLETLDALDKAIFLWLNGLHTPLLDPVMWFVTGRKEWAPFYLLLVVLLFKEYGWYGLAVLLGVGLTILLADQFASGFCKPFFARLRPSHAPDLAGQVHVLHNYLGGKYGFISSHAANTFGLAAFLHLVLRARVRYSAWLFAWAGLVSYSRIYVGVHYPADILAGGLAGVVFGYVVFLLFRWWAHNSRARRLFFDPHLR